MKMERICNILREDKLIRNQLNSVINLSLKENKEYGLNICLNDKISTSEMCAGTECQLQLKSECPKDTKEVVSFHVHTGPIDYERIPSGRDYITISRDKEKSFCIGYRVLHENYIDCYKIPEDVRKANEDFISSYDEYYKIKKENPQDKRLIPSAIKLRESFNKIKQIDNMEINEALGYAGENRLCAVRVSSVSKIHKTKL